MGFDLSAREDCETGGQRWNHDRLANSTKRLQCGGGYCNGVERSWTSPVRLLQRAKKRERRQPTIRVHVYVHVYIHVYGVALPTVTTTVWKGNKNSQLIDQQKTVS
jgi:hypothetical protein